MPRPTLGAGFPRISHPQKRAVLLAYSESMQLGQSCKSARITTRMHRYWLQDDPAYAEAFVEARAMAAEVLEAEAVRRALGTTEGASDTLLIFLLKGAKPDIYKERFEHTGKDGGPLQVQQMAPDARQARLAALLAKRNGHATPVTAEPEGTP